MNQSFIKSVLAAALALGFSPSVFAGIAEMIVPGYQVVTTGNGEAPTAAKVKAAIVDAANRRQWTITETAPGKLTMRFAPRSHELITRVRYDDRGFKIEYVSSQNIEYRIKDGKPYAHANYNVWIKKFSDSVLDSRVLVPAPADAEIVEVLPAAEMVVRYRSADDAAIQAANALSSPEAVEAQAPGAGQTVKINAVIPYRDDFTAFGNAQAQCQWNRELPELLVRYANGQVQITDADLSTLPGRTLRLSILNMRTAGGGNFSGPKWGTVRADLYQDGKMIGRYDHRRRTGGGLFTGGCGALSKIADAMAADIAQRLNKNKFELPEAFYPLPEIGPPETVPAIEQTAAQAGI